jgi:hypothetical protein
MLETLCALPMVLGLVTSSHQFLTLPLGASARPWLFLVEGSSVSRPPMFVCPVNGRADMKTVDMKPTQLMHRLGQVVLTGFR